MPYTLTITSGKRDEVIFSLKGLNSESIYKRILKSAEDAIWALIYIWLPVNEFVPVEVVESLIQCYRRVDEQPKFKLLT